MLPVVSRHTLLGPDSFDEVAWPVSPLKPATPVPAIVVIRPLLAVTFQILLSLVPAIKRLFSVPSAKPSGDSSCLLVAATPSAAEPSPFTLYPATVEMMPDEVEPS